MEPSESSPKTDLPRLERSAPPLARRFVRYVLGFGVGVAIGLAPFLGKARVPGFSALSILIPDSIQPFVYTTSAFMMGTVAVWVQWQAAHKPSRAWQQRYFKRFLILTLTTLTIFVIIQSVVVVTIEGAALDRPISFLIGFNTPPERPPCIGHAEPSECIQRLTFNQSRIASYWGHRSIAFSRLALVFPYLLAMAGFGGLVGVLLIREEPAGRRRARSKRPKPKKVDAARKLGDEA